LETASREIRIRCKNWNSGRYKNEVVGDGRNSPLATQNDQLLLSNEQKQVLSLFGWNKLHWAITGKTAAELIAERAQADKPNMGLQTWKNAPRGKILKSDINIARNYLSEKEIKELDRFVSMYLDYAELQASRQTPMKMADWVKKLDAFLQFNEYQILNNSGTVSHEVAIALASQEYEKYRVIQDRDYISDFERETRKITDSPERDTKKE
jgi:hypothetical protein